MKRYFNTTGFCRPDWHYMIEATRGLEKEIKSLIESKQYFLLHAPRQTGKTTLLHGMARQLNKEGKYISVVFSLESAGYRSISVEKAMMVIISSLYDMAEYFLPESEYPDAPDIFKPNASLLLHYLKKWSQKHTKPIVLFIDEIDSIFNDVLISVLRQLRNGFQLRPDAFPISVALVGLRDIRDFKTKIREMNGALGSGSPFNIKAESFRLENFSKDEIRKLYQQHTDETGQEFSEEIIEMVDRYTGGQPWLVNALANEIVAKILKDDYSQSITPEIVKQAKDNLIERRDTHLDSLMDKLREERVRNIIQNIIGGREIDPDTYNNDLLYTIDLGIVQKTQSGVGIANEIYKEIIVRVLNMSFQDRIAANFDPQWYIKEGKLDMDTLLRAFQKFYRRHAESWTDKFSYQEAGKQLLLMAFLQRIVDNGGTIEREMALGRGRLDLCVEYGGQKTALELKINYDTYTKEDGLEQLSGYLDKLGLQHGYLVLFEPKPSSGIPWEERIKWEDTTYTWQGVERDMTIVEM